MSNPIRKRVPVPGVVVYPRGKKWWYRLELEPDQLTGKRRYEYQGGHSTEDEAWSAALTARTENERGQRVSPSKRTVAEFVTEWLASIRDAIKPTTYTNYVDYLDAYVLPSIGKRKLQDIDVPVLNALYRHLLTGGRRKPDNNRAMFDYWTTRRVAGVEPSPREIAAYCKVTIYAARAAVGRYKRGRLPVAKSAGLAPKTVKNVHRMLHRALSDAVAWRYLSYNPATHASLPRQSRSGRRRRGTTWTPEELTAWLKVAMQDRDAGLWALAATTGMRRSELAGVQRDYLTISVSCGKCSASQDLHAQRCASCGSKRLERSGTLEIFDTRVVVDGKAADSDGKTLSGNRTISLDTFTIPALIRHLAMLDEERQAFDGDYQSLGLLFCHPDGKAIHPDTITRRFNRLVDRAGVRKIRLHDVRHTYATLSLDAGVDPKIVSDRIGHANMAYTLAIYTHRSTGRDQDAAQKVAGLMFDAPDDQGDEDDQEESAGPEPHAA